MIYLKSEDTAKKLLLEIISGFSSDLHSYKTVHTTQS